MNLDQIHCYCTVFIMYLMAINVKGKNILQDDQMIRICSDLKRMIFSGLSQEEAEGLIRADIIRIISHEYTDKELLGELDRKGSQKYARNDGQVVDISTKNMIGKDSILNQMTMLGTDTSTSTSDAAIINIQTDNKFKSSQISDFFLSLFSSLNLKRRDDDRYQKRIHRFDHSRFTTDHRLVNYECEKIIQNVQDQLINRIELNRSLHLSDLPNSREEGENFPSQRSIHDHDDNSTSLATQFDTGPDGVVNYVAQISRGQASNLADRTYAGFQDHGNYENSRVNLLLLTPGLPINLG
ncbi:uncharacterized protein LOC141849201 [Brevipalpus obovatus]|uniref:uncharacterized protein LOC141849201 n=1 Tax=Brevipalpus obovatus TaxID=246614 RepID=UPI003D9DBE3C